jgi:cbb3-type cytochrome oxidase cytochrome c subunit
MALAAAACTGKLKPGASGMPSYGWQLEDHQVAVLTYIRNAWQTAAAPVSADMVTKARAELQIRSDQNLSSEWAIAWLEENASILS